MNQIHRAALKGEHYKAVPISCSPGLHEFSADLLGEFCQGRHIFEIGAGYGALTNRLLDRGWHVEPFDFDLQDWQGQVPVSFVDANDLSGSAFPGALQNAVSLELIEHLRAPLDFIDEVMQRLQPGGCFLFSTPNTRSSISYLHYLLKRELFSFNRAMYWESGHISPIFDFIVEEHLNAKGWTFKKYAAGRVNTGSFIKDLFLKTFSKVFYRIFGGADRYEKVVDQGLCLIYVVSR